MNPNLIDNFGVRGYRLAIGVLLIGVFLLLSACNGRIAVPAEDDTPPEVWMEVLGLGESIIMVPDGDPEERTINDPSKVVTVVTTAVDEDDIVFGWRSLASLGNIEPSIRRAK